MLSQDFRPLLPRQRLAAARAQLEMDVHAALQRIRGHNDTPEDAALLAHASRVARLAYPQQAKEVTP